MGIGSVQPPSGSAPVFPSPVQGPPCGATRISALDGGFWQPVAPRPGTITAACTSSILGLLWPVMSAPEQTNNCPPPRLLHHCCNQPPSSWSTCSFHRDRQYHPSHILDSVCPKPTACLSGCTVASPIPRRQSYAQTAVVHHPRRKGISKQLHPAR